MTVMHYCAGCCAFLLAIVGTTLTAYAQVVPDGTLNTTVTQSGNNFTITNGTTQGNNLFHSFSQFSVPTGGFAFFNNATTIQNIFARVTGGSVSNIDGLIRANGTANLFLLNPSGILFGPNASLNLGGSLIASTANSINFADGTRFSATDTNSPPLLTVSVPVGLQMGTNPGTITVQGPGSQLVDVTGFGLPSTINTPPGLQVGANQTIALIGGAVNFSGGVVTTNGGGHLEVGSVSAGQVGLKSTSIGWIGDYSAVQQFNDIHLAQESLVDASGRSGSILLQGRNISLTEGSALLLQNLTTQPSGGITVNATGSLSLGGTTANDGLGSFIQIINLSTSQTGDVALSAAQLSLQDGARIVTRTRTQADGANITANVSGTTQISGFSPANPVIYTGFVTFSGSQGNAGNITVSTKDLKILDSGQILSVALRSGNSGAIRVNATDQVEIVGYNPLAFSESSLATFTQGSGNANNTIINTARLVLQGGASVGSSTVATGSAGSVEINASESINVQGRGQGNASGVVSRIFSSAELLSPETQAAFDLPAIPTGNAGSLTIRTRSLRLADGGSVSVKNDGPGLAGNVQIQTKSLFLDNQSNITAAAQSGEGGNIFLQASTLILRHGSLISATAGGIGNGGNITINSPIIAGFENSDIIANASQGRGGNINITTQGIIGLKYRTQLTPENDITASSEFGVSGTVQVNNIGVDPNSGLVKLPTNVADSSKQIVTGCAGSQGSSFTATGRGGVPQNPTQQVMNDRTWDDVRDLSAYRKAGETVAQRPATVPMLIEANTWQRHADGTVELIADQSSVTNSTFATCSGVTTSAIESAPQMAQF